MHDVLEGVAQYETKELLKYLISEKIVTLADVNKRISEFPYSYVDVTDKPTLIAHSTLTSSDHNVKQKGIVMLFSYEVCCSARYTKSIHRF